MLDWFELVPKVELHLHLEGSIPHEALWDLINKYGGDIAVPTIEMLVERFCFRDFSHFIEMWIWKNKFIREYDDFTFIAEAIAHDLVRQNIRYVEAFFSPTRFSQQALTPQRLTEALRLGFSREPKVEVALVADLVRDLGPKLAAITLSQVHEVREMGIIGIGLGGSEQHFPPELFHKVFSEAHRLGFKTTAHAGETAGSDSIWGAIRSLHVDRIGHGTRAEEDEVLLDYLAEHKIPLEMCPISNVKTGVIGSISAHPIHRYYNRGLLVTVNTDDPKMFGNSLAEELRELSNCFSLTRQDIRKIILSGLEASWLSSERKMQMVETIVSDPVWYCEE